METWKPAPDRPGYRRKIIQRGPATIVIDRPELSEAAQAKAQSKARTALEGTMRDYYSRNARKGVATA